MSKQMFIKHDEDDFLNTFDARDLPWSEKELNDEKRRQRKFDEECKDAVLKAKKQRRKEELKEISTIYGSNRKKVFDMSTTTKQIIFFLLLNCTVVEVYSMLVIWRFGDLSALPALITAAVTETITFAVYCVKSYLETKSEKNLEFETKKLELDRSSANDNNVSDDIVDDYIPDDLVE